MPLDNLMIVRDIKYSFYDFPVSSGEIRRILRIVSRDVEGLAGIEIIEPRRNEEFNFYGKYDNNSRTIYLFAHLKKGKRYVLGCFNEVELSSTMFKRRILDSTIYHELGHHVGWTRYRDVSEKFANDYLENIQKLKNRR